jgi:hypothetical protein
LAGLDMKQHDMGEYEPEGSHIRIAYCHTCGAEGKELPRECPGKMSQSEKNAVALGDVDYYNGAWHRTEKARN